MKMKTINGYKKGSKRYKKLARKSQKALRMWRKAHPNCHIINVTREIYNGYFIIDILCYDKKENEKYTTHFHR